MRKKSVVTIGVFDGVHMGHRAVIRRAMAEARKKGLKSVVVTFDPHPAAVLGSGKSVPSLISLKHRVSLIKDLGIDDVVILRFNRALASMPAEKFIKGVIIGKLSAKTIVVGEDFCFGKGALSDADELRGMAKKYSVGVKIVKHLKMGGRVVSSTLIRELVVNGRTEEASKLLGRPFSILGTVVAGAKLARALGYPTANVNPHHEAMPPSGVYAVKVKFRGRRYNGVMNIGVRPTFYDHGRDKEPSIEVHIFDFNGRIYGHDLEITFIRRLRAEKKFNTIDSLIRQIKKDELAAKHYLL